MRSVSFKSYGSGWLNNWSSTGDINIFGINMVAVKEVEDTGGRMDGGSCRGSLQNFGQVKLSGHQLCSAVGPA